MSESVVQRIGSLTGILAVFGGLTLSVVLYYGVVAIYNIWFHPLSSYPGPKRAVAARFWYSFSLCSGRLPFDIKALHEQYGDVVRVAPDELSYTNSEAWKDIYGHRSGKPEMTKDPVTYKHLSSGTNSIIGATRDRHSHIRRLLAHGFSDKALREQEQDIQKYADLLFKRLHEQSQGGKQALDMVAWYNYFTFDLIGDLAFGESFGCLESSSYHPWVSMIFDNVKTGSFLRAAGHYPLVERLIQPMIPKQLVERRRVHRQLGMEKARHRKEIKTDRLDFLSRMVQPDADVSEMEYIATANTLIIAGSETTATLLSACTFYLLTYPSTLKKLEDEIRAAFAKEEEINFISVNDLKYLLACLDESLRMFPPVPGNFPRTVPPGGDIINGRWVPQDTVVSISHFATYHSKENFSLPDDFIPERWLGDERFKGDNKAALQPFHIGPRNCIGRNLAYLEMRLIVSRMLWNFDLELVEGCERWSEQNVFLLWEKHPLWVKLKPVIR